MEEKKDNSCPTGVFGMKRKRQRAKEKTRAPLRGGGGGKRKKNHSVRSQTKSEKPRQKGVGKRKGGM